MLSRVKIRWKVLFSSYVIMLFAVSMITAYFVFSIEQDASREIEALRLEEMDKVKANLKNFVGIAYETISANIREAQDIQ